MENEKITAEETKSFSDSFVETYRWAEEIEDALTR